MSAIRGIIVLAAVALMPALAQAQQITDLSLPRIAVAPDRSYAVAAEALVRTETDREVLHVLVQMYAPNGAAVGTHLFAGESCSGLDLWLFDYMSLPDIAFQPNGTLVVLMQHAGEFQLGGDGIQSAEMTMVAIDANGQLFDLNSSSSCVQQKLIFPGGGRQDRPRMAMSPNGGTTLVTADGFFNDANLRNVAVRVLDGTGTEVIEQVIPHDDPQSEASFHMQPDVATNGDLALVAWQECPIIDNQGNAETCDIGAQFASISVQGLLAVGGNVTVNAGNPPGTLQLYPSAAMNGAGQSVIVWADARDGAHGEIYAQRFGPSGEPTGGNIRVSEGQGEIVDLRPEVAILENGRFMVAWTDSSAGRYFARGRIFDAEGNPEGAPFELAPDAFHSGQASVAPDGDNFAYVYLTAGESGPPEIGSNKALLTDVEQPELPEATTLRIESLYPNPFRESATIRWNSPEPGRVTVRVYDVLGRVVARPLNAVEAAGRHEITLSGVDLAPGVYFVEVMHGAGRAVGKLIQAE